MNTIYFGDRKLIFKNLYTEYSSDKFLLLSIEKMNLSVDEVRFVKDFVNKTGDKEKIIILSSFYWNDSVQNALLKVLEDTPANTKIFLIGISKNFFLPTVLSRMQKVSSENLNKYQKFAKEILAKENYKRLGNKKLVKLLAQKTEEINIVDGEISIKKDREEHILFLQALINEIIKPPQPHFGKEGQEVQRVFWEQINTITQDIYDPGASPHLFIEWLLLSAPKIDMV